MKKLLIAILFLLSCFNIKAQTAKAYSEQYGQLAVEEMRKFGIPASITLAQAIIESGAGNTKLAKIANNHFGVKAGKSWKGERYGSFRKYESVMEAYDDRSAFLTGRKNYAFLFKIDQCNYKAWAKGLQRSGYAASKRYASDLIRCIEKNKLFIWDQEICGETAVQEQVPDETAQTTEETALASTENQPVEELDKPAYKTVYHRVKKGESLFTIAKNFKTTVNKLKSLNSLHSSKIKPGQRLRVK